MPQHRRISEPDAPVPVALSPDDPLIEAFREAAAVASNLAAATYYESKLIQPHWGRISFNGAQEIYEVDAPWSASWLPQSILVVNPFAFPVYVAANGDPTAGGVPFPPQSALRLPIAGQAGSLVLAVEPTDIGTDSGTVHLFRFPTVD